MTKALIGVVAMIGSAFTMCQGGPVPHGCCKPGDSLNVILTSPTPVKDCDNMGGALMALLIDGRTVYVCEGVDF